MAGTYDVRAYGATGDGHTLDTVAVNRAINAADRDGGGTVSFPAGVYLCHSIHLKSNVALYIGEGATIMAAPPAKAHSAAPSYDLPEPNPYDAYQDFGHNHWHNSLIWGENLVNVAILGPGMIDGSRGLVRSISLDRSKPKLGEGLYSPSPTTAPTTSPITRATTAPTTQPSSTGPSTSESSTTQTTTQASTTGASTTGASTSQVSATQATSQPASQPTSRSTTRRSKHPSTSTKPATKPTTSWDNLGDNDGLGDGLGNKAIALKLCRNVILRDFSVRCGGHFAILATGVDNCTIDNLKLDTNRDGMDLDCCRNVRVSNCYVNSPSDDGICPKSSFALGYARATENLTITNCQVSAYAAGSFLDGTYHLRKTKDGNYVGGTGRIKCGTESNGGFKNITISNCIFDYCHGIALESVDGALMEDIAIDNITMRHVVECPIFIRLGARLRGPKPATVIGAIQRINISNVVVYDADMAYSSIVSGVPGYPIKDVKLNNIQIFAHGGGKPEWATTRPAEIPEKYPETHMFGPTPAYGFFVRHVDGIEFNNVAIHFDRPETRPPFVLQDVNHANFVDVDAQSPDQIAPVTLRQVTDVSTLHCANWPDTSQPSVDEGSLGNGQAPGLDAPDDTDDTSDTP